jgi:hypothetical protein
MRELAQTDLFMCIIKENTSRVRDEILNSAPQLTQEEEA